ncbi:MAG TPA: BatD family protein [Myxococcales bacterium LLY-WYZ-16_1]|nr:BatD family protein [Myxococcales bacterium LLY-WYZ-16_1]
MGAAPWVLWALAGPAAGPGQVTVEVDLSPTQVQVDDYVSARVIAVSTAPGALSVQMPEVPGLREVSRSRREGTSFSFGNQGQSVRREVVIELDYVAVTPGSHRFPPVKAEADEVSGASDPIPFEVLGPEAAPPTDEDPPANGLFPPDPGDEDAFVRYRISKERAYRGEQVVVEMVLLARPELRFEPVSAPIPAYDGVWTQVLEKPSFSTRSRERVGGKTWAAYRLWKVALFALKPEPLNLPPAEVVIRPRRRYGRAGPPMRRTTRTRTVPIDPLPREGRPPAFPPGNVGHLTLSAEVDQRKVETGRGLMLTLTLSGTGNVPQFELPEVPAIEGFEAYPPKVDARVDAGPNGVSGRKVAEVLLTPQSAGVHTIPGFEVWTFDPEDARYRKLDTAPIRVDVEGSAAPPTPKPEAAAAEAPPDGVRDRPPLRPGLARARLSSPHARIPGLLGALLLAAPWVAMGGWALVGRSRGRGRRGGPKQRALAAAEMARELAKQRDPQAWVHASEAFSWVLCGRADGHPTDLRERVRAQRLADSDTTTVIRAIEQAEAVRYAPSLVEPATATSGPVWKRIIEEISS